jgi:glycosyltransferase involved in cell wall biosynthesis
MRITFVTSRINLRTGGGSNYSLHLTASELCHLGHEVHLVTLYGSDVPSPEALPYRVTSLSWSGSRFAQMRLVDHILQEETSETDLFHIYEPHLAFGGGRYRQHGGQRPVVVTLNSYQVFCTNLALIDGRCHRSCGVTKRLLHSPSSLAGKARSVPVRLYEHFAGFQHVNAVDQFLPDSPAVERIYAEAGFDMSKSTVIPEVLDYAQIRATLPATSGTARPGGDGVWHILFAGRLVAAKGVDLLIEALAQIDTPVHLHIAGDGPEHDALQAIAGRLGVQERVTFHGWVPNEELWRMYRQVHLFVHPGRWPEPCGRTIQEAMALGVPVVTSDIGGPPWLVGESGLTFRPGDVAGLVRSIETCLSQYDAALARAERAEERAAQFDYRQVVPMIHNVYLGVAGLTARVPVTA